LFKESHSIKNCRARTREVKSIAFCIRLDTFLPTILDE